MPYLRKLLLVAESLEPQNKKIGSKIAQNQKIGSKVWECGSQLLALFSGMTYIATYLFGYTYNLLHVLDCHTKNTSKDHFYFFIILSIILLSLEDYQTVSVLNRRM